MLQGHFADAVEHYGRALQLKPHDPILLRSIDKACEITGWKNAEFLRVRSEVYAAQGRADHGEAGPVQTVAISHSPDR